MLCCYLIQIIYFLCTCYCMCYSLKMKRKSSFLPADQVQQIQKLATGNCFAEEIRVKKGICWLVTLVISPGKFVSYGFKKVIVFDTDEFYLEMSFFDKQVDWVFQGY